MRFGWSRDLVRHGVPGGPLPQADTIDRLVAAGARVVETGLRRTTPSGYYQPMTWSQSKFIWCLFGCPWREEPHSTSNPATSQ